MQSLSALSLLLAVSAQGPTQAPPATTPFARVYKLKEQVSYHLVLEDKNIGPLKAVVQLNVLKLLPKGGPQILLKTTEYDTPGSSTTEKPDEQTCLFSANNVPDRGLKIMHSNFVYMFVGVAGATPDKVVKLGDEFPVSINFNDSSTTLKGGGKLTNIDSSKKTVTIEWKWDFTMSGQSFGSLALTSVYDQTNYCLIRSNGSFDGQVGPTHMLVTIGRIESDRKPAK